MRLFIQNDPYLLLNASSGKGVRIAVLDSGLNPTALGIVGKDYGIFDCYQSAQGLRITALPEDRNADRNGHGTYVQSCIYQNAPHSRVDHYRILDESNNAEGALLCSTLEHVVAQKYNIVNLSLGTRSEKHVPWLVSIMKRAYENHVNIVAAHSNLGNTLYPARFTYCISCRSMSSSNRLALKFHPHSVIEFSAAGVDVSVKISEEKTTSITGSSYATGHLTGILARILEIYGCDVSPLEAKMFLCNYALNFLDQGSPSSALV